MDKKFELTEETIEVDGRTLHRIKALRDIKGSFKKKGDLGGFVEKEENLSHKGECWIYGNACVYGSACVYGNAWVNDNAHIFGSAQVYGNARVYGSACVYDIAHIFGNARVYGSACVYGHAHVYGVNARVFGIARVHDYAYVALNAWIYDSAHVSGDTLISENMEIGMDARITSNDDVCSISSFGSRNRSTTFFKCEDNTIKVVCGCFKGTLDEFRDKVKETHGNNQYAKEYLAITDVAELRFNRKNEVIIMEKKFELTNETIVVDGRILHRIKSLRDIPGTPIKKGYLGGFVEKEENLSHEGNCWIYDNARIFGDACVYADARVSDNAHVYDNARVYGNAWVYGNALVRDNARVYGDANIKSLDDICYISSFGSRNGHTTFFRCKDNTIKVKCGCFTGTLDEFRDKVKETHGDNKYAKEYLLSIDLAELKFSHEKKAEVE